MVIQTEYLIDQKGKKKSVVLPIRNYVKLLEHLEDMEDALDLKKAKKDAKDFIDFGKFTAKLKKQGRIQ